MEIEIAFSPENLTNFLEGWTLTSIFLGFISSSK
jgi:hypothetical protein